FIFDATPPTVALNQAANQADPTSNSLINFTVIFSEPVTGFSSEGVLLGGSAGATTKVVTGSGANYNLVASGMTQSSAVTTSILENADQDAAGNFNTASTSTDNSVHYIAPDTTVPDTTPPTVTIEQAASQSDPTDQSPIRFTVVFSEAVTGFTGNAV